MQDLNIRRILESVNQGQLRVPAFQRGFVWDPNKVAFLMDSIYKQYPIGSLLLWRTKQELSSEKKLGSYELPKPIADYPIDYILDGQQRITSIFGVFQTDIQPNVEASWMNIYYDLKGNDDVQESQFFALDPSEVDVERYFPLNVLFDVIAYRDATKQFDSDAIKKIDNLQTVFREALVPVQMIDTEDRTKIAIVFERVNQSGVPLDTLQLLTAWTWSQDFDLQRKFEDLSAELESFGFEDVGADENLLLRCCSAVIEHNPSIQTLINLNGSVVRDRFEEVTNGIKGAIDFLQANLNIYSLKNLPYASLLIPLSAFFSCSGNSHQNYDDSQRRTIIRWFWRVCFSKRYNSQPLKSLQTDVREMIKLKEGMTSELGEFARPTLTPQFFLSENFRYNNVNTRTFVLLLSKEDPRSFKTGSPIAMKDVLKDYNKNEFHHLYPRAFLKTQGTLPHDVSCLANFCFMSRADNSALGGVAPSKYKSKMPADVSEILTHSLCPNSLFDDDFSTFVTARAEKLAAKANGLMS